MKKSLMATFVAALILSPMSSFAAEPMGLSTAQMDSVTAGTGHRFGSRIAKINIATNLQIVNQKAIAVNTGKGFAAATNVAVVNNNVRQN